MLVIENENTIFFDVDGTLVTRTDNGNTAITLNNYGVTREYFPITAHVEMVKSAKNRGKYVVVWSQNGYAWAKEAALALGLESYVDAAMTKPNVYVDDLESKEWMFRIFLGGK